MSSLAAETSLPELTSMVQEIVAFVREQYMHGNPSEIPLDKSLVDEGILDSYAVIELVTFIEKRYGISITTGEIVKANFGSINLMAKFVLSKTAGKP
jgi:acyl carrier protein